MENFSHLHCHSEYTMLGGVGTVEKWYEAAKEKNITAIALTEHGNMGSAMASYLTSIKQDSGVKCIFGCQFLMTQTIELNVKEEHIVCLAKNEIGFNNLLKLNQYAWTTGYDKRRMTPRVLMDELKNNCDGLYVLTGSLNGPLGQTLLAGYHIAEKAFDELYEAFGDRLLPEVQLHEVYGQQRLNELVLKLAKHRNLIPILTNDCKYPSKGDDNLLYIVKRMSSFRKMKVDEDDSSQKWLKSVKQLDSIRRRLHGYITESQFKKLVENTNGIAEQCNHAIEIGHHSLPKYDVQSHPLYKKDIKTNIDLFLKIANDGFDKKIRKHEVRSQYLKTYRKRFKYEWSVIEKTGFIDYFLIVEDIIRWSKLNGIEVGAARGSVAGSLLAFCMDITDVDPIQFDLLFERFLNPTRVSGERAKSADALPDIDLDFERTRRNDVKQYIIDKYGKDNVCTIGSYQTMGLRSTLKDLYRVFEGELPVEENTTLACEKKDIDDVCRLIGDKVKTVQDALKIPEFKKLQNKYPRFIDYYCANLHGQIKAASRHAAGVLVTPTPMIDWIPVRTQKIVDEDSERVVVSQWEDTYCERRGLLKLDILGIKALDSCKYARELIQRRHGEIIDIRHIDLDDKKVLRRFSKGDTEGSFQYNSDLQSSFLPKLGKRIVFEDLITTNAVLRPGPMDAGAHQQLVDRKNGDEDITYDHPCLEPYLRKTYGLYIYQEDVMTTAHVLGGLTLAQADIMRSAIKKKDPKMISEFQDMFVEGCVEKGLSVEKGKSIWASLLSFSSYGFNRSHSASYALLGYYCQWIKVHYPIEFWVGMLQYAKDDIKSHENIWMFRKSAMKDNIGFEQPLATRTNHFFFITKNNKIAWPIRAIKGVGIKAAMGIAAACRASKPSTFNEFINAVPRRVVNKKVVEKLICANAFRKYGTQSEIMKEYYEDFRKSVVPDAFKNLKEKDWLALTDDTLGYLTISIKQRHRGWFSDKCATVDRLKSVSENQFLIMGGKIERCFRYESKRGPIFFINVTDLDGTFLMFVTTAFYKAHTKTLDNLKVGDIVEALGRKAISYRGEIELLISDSTSELQVMEDGT